ncbi:MAG: lipoyl(octanoyl) transferase [Anaerolineaceae bacterium]|nr:MAG: lipoyl(octanoyl) transferase [Anaerolineaceae bacterium]
MRSLSVIDLGLIDYAPAWKLQDEYAAEIAAGTRPPTLLLLEHPHTFTFGRKGHAENLLWSPEELTRRGVSVHWVDRGGDVTYHGPGQLVGYPLIPLSPISYPLTPSPALSEVEGSYPASSHIPNADYVGYVRKLEETLIAALARLGVVSGQRSGLSGVWVQADVYSRCVRCRPEDRAKPAKIAAIGVKVDAKGVTRHGFALNVNPEMEYWDGIVACGLSEPVVALADLLDPVPTMKRVKAEVAAAFAETRFF